MPRARLKLKRRKKGRPSKTPEAEPEELVLPFGTAVKLDEGEIVRTSVCKLDDQMIRRICALVSRGFTLSATCDYLSISSASLYTWRRKGELFLDGNGEPREFEKYAVLLLSLRKALATALLRFQDNLMTSDFAWVKYLAILERRDPLNFGKDSGSPEDDVFDASETFL